MMASFHMTSLIVASALLLACGDSEDDAQGGRGSADATTTTTTPDAGASSSTGTGTVASSQKIDVIFAVDNSSDGGEATRFVVDAATSLLNRLANPECVDDAGNVQPAPGPGASCPEGYRRAFTPATDMHVGVITSSLGGLGGGTCDTTGTEIFNNPSNNDLGHLVWRTDPSPAATANTPGITYQEQGFFAWDPGAAKSPPGIADLTTLIDRVGSVIQGAGSAGCGWEMPLESAYRFLVDPEPYAQLLLEGSGAIPKRVRSGVDAELLAQRAAFLREDSIVIVVMSSAANDCSVIAEGQSWAVLRATERWFRGSSKCATDPADACCYSCGQGPPSGCAADPICMSNPTLTAQEDPLTLRCAAQKQRFGVSSLYPPERYVNAFSKLGIGLARPDLSPSPTDSTPNPLFVRRSPRDVFLVTVTGVPWQPTVDDPMTVTRLLDGDGLDATSFWPRFVGNEGAGVLPTEPIMLESVDPRPGVIPGNVYNGKDYVIGGNDDLQLACIFPLETPIPFSSRCQPSDHPNGDKPICSFDTQTHGAAYPSTRQLRVAQGLQQQSVVGSLCPPEAGDAAAPTYGFRLAVDALAQRLYGR